MGRGFQVKHFDAGLIVLIEVGKGAAMDCHTIWREIENRGITRSYGTSPWKTVRSRFDKVQWWVDGKRQRVVQGGTGDGYYSIAANCLKLACIRCRSIKKDDPARWLEWGFGNPAVHEQLLLDMSSASERLAPAPAEHVATGQQTSRQRAPRVGSGTRRQPPRQLMADGAYIIEGKPTEIKLDRFERKPQARAKCIDHYKCQCFVCEFNFEKEYGKELGEGFIHVHHLTPLSKIRRGYNVDPVKHMRPLCPNCHAMIHRMRDPSDIEGFKQRWLNEHST